MRTVPTRAQRQARTREDLVDAAERLFTARGFGATSLDAVADEAGYTKGAVYSNFASKEDLFFAVYERRAERAVAEVERMFAEADAAAAGARRLAAAAAARREHDDGWLAVFFEFWTHILRHPEHRERFAAIHARALEPHVSSLERHAAEHGVELPLGARRLAVALHAMVTGLSLERLTQPDIVGPELSEQVLAVFVDGLGKGG